MSLKVILIKEETHQALKMYCVANNLNIQDTADTWITERLLEEAGGIKE